MAALIANPLIAPVLPAELSYASPAIRTRPPTLFAPAPPLFRARRSDGSSSDESLRPGPDGFEETDLRAGGPRLPESPCETTETLPRIYWNHDLFQGHGSYVLDTQLRKICERENIWPISIRFCERRSVYESATDLAFTLLVVARRDQSQGSWISLARKLSNHLRGQGLQGLNVEITDPKFSKRPKIHPCLPTDAIFPIWTQVGTDIFDRIERTGVFTIGCFRIGSDYDLHKCPPTILLGVDKNVRRDWRDLREAVISILDRYNLTAVAVAIRKDNKTTRDGQPGNQDPGARREHCRLDPKMGASISPRTAHDSNGTLGGWVEVKAPKSGEWLPFALTCSHCCFPAEAELSEEDLKVIREWKDRGVNQRDAHRARLLPVDSPSYRDMKKGLKSIAADIKSQKSKPLYQEVENLRREDGFIVPYKEKIWRTISKIIRSMEGDQTHMTEFFNSKSHHLGIVFAASGEREMQSTDNPTKLSIRDWALIQPAPSRRAGENTMTPPSTGPGAGWENLTRLQTDIPGLADTLLKVGRATGHTPGTYGGLKTCNIVKKIINGKRVDVKTWEHVMLRTGDKAIEEGDSGSLVFDDIGGVLGMIFGGSGHYDLGYFTATSDLLADIQLITGLKDVRLCGEE